MLTFEQKISILEVFPELERRDVSLGRVNFHYEDSVYDKKTVVYHLHPNGNGFVYGALLSDYKADSKGLVNIRDFSAEELKAIVHASIRSLSGQNRLKPTADGHPSVSGAAEQASTWADAGGHTLNLLQEDDMWYIYASESLEMVFETLDEAEEYLREEGFSPS
ncbi:hypothetical protein OIN60_10725 [Paenibacillus sp. P96]|uniref:Uncharacterized protein n=1 Tax=Paenibacillus zeirhizosphaerae TaxID=2987519 RepID=A0ABT9FR96_9BACL|nr:hypothetical protein [Paenibacillus sp. P96]MDP4097244.1 hypothetical protein [Paenibacillus sp. P96]